MSGPAEAAQVVFRPAPAPFGAILAGGASRRFGAPKALAPVDGIRLGERVRDAIRAAGLQPRLITASPELFADLHLPSRPDLVPGAGPLSGIHAALSWAAEEGRTGALCVSCDLPFLEPGLLRALCEMDPEALVAPESSGPAGIEPLCAYYPTRYLPEIAARLARGAHRLQDLLTELPVQRIPLAQVRRWGDPHRIFLNVNTQEDRRHAEAVARG